jgi:hypothetical protein
MGLLKFNQAKFTIENKEGKVHLSRFNGEFFLKFEA